MLDQIKKILKQIRDLSGGDLINLRFYPDNSWSVWSRNTQLMSHSHCYREKLNNCHLLLRGILGDYEYSV